MEPTAGFPLRLLEILKSLPATRFNILEINGQSHFMGIQRPASFRG